MNDNELDLAVAKHVFGETFLRCKLGIPMDAHLNGGCDNCLSYSTTGDGMLAVIEKMRELHFRCEIRVGAETTKCIGTALYHVTFDTDTLFLVNMDRKNAKFGNCNDGEGPRAVAIAALRALGVEV